MIFYLGVAIGAVGMAVILAVLSTSCENENVQYVTFCDGLRLIFDHGEYVGWYVCGEG